MDLNRSWLIYASYTIKGEEHCVDYTLTAPSRAAAKQRAMERMGLADGINRHIDAINEIDEAFRQREADMVEH